ncbi:hypothetical protein J3R30DRAFT_3503243 [Lentinula aciculospora]|uniref:RanBD1 domain-containing protein n=1 Tax=Lentinula aciculospora TaxID=153920 RepID=A0A9W9DL48_9AGAR|nr:hypothetical protein J3R30DRAFT_3503243 [Lentinula aciculospora]
MSDDEVQRQPEALTTNMPIDKAHNQDSSDTNNASVETQSNSRDDTGRRSPVTPPSPNFDESEIKSSRKREREVSQEPVSSSGAKQHTALDSTSHTHDEEKDYARTPAKKNRIHRSVELDVTAEEEDGQASSHHRSRSNSSEDSNTDSLPITQADLGIAASPPQDMKIKVRQISQGVEDLTWRQMKKHVDENGALIERSMITVGEDKIMEEDILPIQVGSSSSSTSVSRRDSDPNSTAEGVLNLKRKYPERGPSAEPPNGLEASSSSITAGAPGIGAEASVKRPRDDSGEDDNPRVTKRPTPPPEEKEKALPIKQAPSSGFMAYASTSSPFASIKGQNVFSSSANFASSSTSSAIKTPLPSSPVLGRTDISSSSGTKRSGFGAFASSSSPFAAVAKSKSPVLGSSGTSALGGGARAKSPSRRTTGSPSRPSHSSITTTSVFGSSAGSNNKAGNNAFTAYASGGVQGFALPFTKRARGDGNSEEHSTVGGGFASAVNDVFSSSRGGSASGGSSSSHGGSFGEKLRAAGKGSDEEDVNGDEEWDESRPKVNLSEQEVSTGEELEETIHQVRGKLFALIDGAWRERGTGVLKLNVRAEDGGGARLVMRKEAVYTLLLNVTLFAGMKCTLAQDPRYVRFSVFEDGHKTTHFNLRLANTKIAAELMEAIHENLPEK